MPNDAPAIDGYDTFVARGHEIISESLASAQRLAAEYPAVKLLLPVIAGTLHDLFNHMVATHGALVEVADVAADLDALQAKATELAPKDDPAPALAAEPLINTDPAPAAS